MMEQPEFVHRRGGGPVRRPSRHKRPPWILWVLLALAVVVILVVVVVKAIGGNRDPDEPASSAVSAVSAISTPEGTPNVPDATPTPEPVSQAPAQTAPDSAPEDMGSFMIAGDAGYAYYKFDEETTNNYIMAIDSAGDALSGTAALYLMVVPTSMDVMLPESYLTEHSVDSSDQRKAIDSYINPSITAMNPGVKTVSLFTTLRQHSNEPIYFRTDRTWTQLGGYYAYTEFCKAKGLQAIPLDQFTKNSYEGFLGGFYRESESDSLYYSADTVDAYTSSANTSLAFTDQNGEVSEGWSVISNGEGYDSSLLYLIFAAGDQPYKVLENSDITDGSACVVVQDSYGNFFIPFLTSHYQRVYVVDYRYYSGSVPQLAREVGASDVIILHDVTATSRSSAVDSIVSLF